MSSRSAAMFCMLLIFSSSPIYAGSKPKTRCERDLSELVRDLPATSQIAMAVKESVYGDAYRRPWMDQMRHYGVKRAQLQFKFAIGNIENFYDFKLIRVDYYQTYEIPLKQVSDQSILEELHSSGLEEELRQAAVQFLTRILPRTLEKAKIDNYVGTVSYPLFDDECVPRLYGTLSVESTVHGAPTTSKASEGAALH